MSKTEVSSTEYIAQVNRVVKQVVESPDYLDPSTGYVSQAAWNSLVQGGILAAALHDRDPKNYRREKMAVIRDTSSTDPQLGLMYGIMTALVIDNIYKFAPDGLRNEYFDKIRDGRLCGLAFTERKISGSSIQMNSRFTENGYLTFSKRFQGISGHDLLVFAQSTDNPYLLGLFLVEKQYITTEFIQTEGLGGIPYAFNSGHVPMDIVHQIALLHTRKDLGVIQQIFTESRLGFPGMSLGQLELLERIAKQYSENRLIGASLQKDMAIPKSELESIMARRMVVQAIYEHSIDYLNLHPDTLRLAPEGSLIKALSTEYALLAALTAAKLGGGDSYTAGSKLSLVNDIWPFTIFEGNNDMLYSQAGRSLARSLLYDQELPGGLFDRSRAAQNLFPGSKAVIDRLVAINKDVGLENIWGQIAARCLALGCLDKDRLDTHDYTLATELLNLEIQQIGLKYKIGI